MASGLVSQSRFEAAGCFNQFLANVIRAPWRRAIRSMCRSRVTFALIAVTLTASVSAAQKIVLSVDASKPGAKIDRNIFGQFAEHLGHGIYDGIWVGPDSNIPNTRGIRNDVVAALKALKVPNVRWPGGCFADEYHWRNGIGPQRVVTLNPNWGGVIEPNTFGTHEVHGLPRPDRQPRRTSRSTSVPALRGKRRNGWNT